MKKKIGKSAIEGARVLTLFLYVRMLEDNMLAEFGKCGTTQDSSSQCVYMFVCVRCSLLVETKRSNGGKGLALGFVVVVVCFGGCFDRLSAFFLCAPCVVCLLVVGGNYRVCSLVP